MHFFRLFVVLKAKHLLCVVLDIVFIAEQEDLLHVVHHVEIGWHLVLRVVLGLFAVGLERYKLAAGELKDFLLDDLVRICFVELELVELISVTH